MRSRDAIREAFFVPTFAPLRASIWAVLGLSAAACGGNVTIESSGGGGGSGGSSSSSTTTPTTFVCDGAVAVPQANGGDSGFVKCADGTIHRDHPVTCDTSVPACQGDENTIVCKTDAECVAAPNGKCAHYAFTDLTGETTQCSCTYPCANDGDCEDGSVCVCAGVVPSDNPWPACSTAACATGEDCASGECGISSYDDGCGRDVQLACRTLSDPCRLDAQCTDGYQCVTSYFTPGGWGCQTTDCAIGRPLLVEGHARTAGRASRTDWSDPTISPDVASLAPDVRAALAATWRDVAALEHASIASFARFSLELIALGAPPDLLVSAAQAAADEIAHARMAYAFASAYAGRALGPAELDVAGVAPATATLAITCALVEEACVGETLGAAEARALAGMVSDPVLAAAYARIADDESRHAELGWRTLLWLLRDAGEEVRRAASAAFDRSIAAASVDPTVPSTVVAPEHGLLSSSMLGALRRQALSEVIAPCARGLLSAHTASA